MKGDLKITLVQPHLAWEAPLQNIVNLSKLIGTIRKSSTNLILLPEMFTTGFSMNAMKLAEPMNGNAVEWMIETAAKKNAVLCGSLIIKAKGNYFNRLIWAQPDGKILYYDKRHLFTMAKENKVYTPGKKKLVVNLIGWKICPLVCYDLRFPVWSRSDGTVDLLLYVANWPSRRSYAWKQLLIARAIENQCYVAGLNRVGNDGENIDYTGDSIVLDPMGMPVKSIMPSAESVTTITLPLKPLSGLRKTFPVMNDADTFTIK